MKELHSGHLFWPLTMEEYKNYPALSEDLQVQVAIIGGGMSGAMCAYVFEKSGISTAVLERDTIAGGSTSANTGLLQFSNDIMLCDLINQIGRQPAVQFYAACANAVKQIGLIAGELAINPHFVPRRSLYYASSEQDLPKLHKEYDALRQNGFDVSFWEADEIAKHFPFRRPGAIITNGDAEVNPFRFVHGVADAAAAHGARIYEHTDVIDHERKADGKHQLTTATGHVISAEKVIYAIGYEPEELRGQLIKPVLNRSFAAVTAVQDKDKLLRWHEQMFIWETARPYLYMRTTLDGRIIIGGLDEEFEHPVEGERERGKRINRLYDKLTAHFPMLDVPFEYEWSATFGESFDNLPFVGEDPAQPGVYYCLGYGGNGTVYSMIASYVLHDLIKEGYHPLADIVGLKRPTLQT
ncbi:FAD-binding oxidoreductase [Paenibacillus glycanilyticus]|uniref:NAD(P)/FAD-dependent oxidoreductase n=1 Tax=Paenibacillus glycanilyticus TaxID=126569 RepID=UPI00203ED03F|nr:FAD-dependent oxidoreductase [Paenibacillus glycanilyticus]MCM3630935.1 FAD-binding oxidoreductase [Paenibacillus glycanilyticus]